MTVRICVCVKRVPAPGARINLSDDARAIDTTHLAFTTSPHEECALEAAVQLVEEHGGEVTVLTLGPPEAEEQLRHAVSVGAHRAVLLASDGDDWDPQRTARAIVDAIGELEAADGAFDLVLFGNESADSGGFQVGIRVAFALDRPMVNGAKGLSIVERDARVERESDAGREIYELPLPAAVGVKEGINLPRYPTMRGRLASKKAEVATLEPSAPAGGLAMVQLERPVEKSPDTIILDSPAAIVDVLDDLGVLR